MQKPAEVVLFYSFLCILKWELSMNQYSQYGEQAPQENHSRQGVVLSIIDPVSVDIVWLESYRARSWLYWSQWQLPYQLMYAKVIVLGQSVCSAEDSGGSCMQGIISCEKKEISPSCLQVPTSWVWSQIVYKVNKLD